jgi:hypothetical protein
MHMTDTVVNNNFHWLKFHVFKIVNLLNYDRKYYRSIKRVILKIASFIFFIWYRHLTYVKINYSLTILFTTFRLQFRWKTMNFESKLSTIIRYSVTTPHIDLLTQQSYLLFRKAWVRTQSLQNVYTVIHILEIRSWKEKFEFKPTHKKVLETVL